MNTINERPHKKLRVWQKAMELVTSVYTMTAQFPRAEEFGLKAQLRRAAVSVPSNIAEGLVRRTKADKLHFLNMSQASLSEIDTQVEITSRLEYLDGDSFAKVMSEILDVQMLLSGLIRSIR